MPRCRSASAATRRRAAAGDRRGDAASGCRWLLPRVRQPGRRARRGERTRRRPAQRRPAACVHRSTRTAAAQTGIAGLMNMLMNRIAVLLSMILVTTAAMPAASPAPTAAPAESASEKQFVAAVTTDLQNRFSTTQKAAAAGYFRYTDEDQTGAISWVNTSSWASDQTHPSQLWYDVNGRLIGADFSVLQSSSTVARTFGASRLRAFSTSPRRTCTSRLRPHRGLRSGASDRRR